MNIYFCRFSGIFLSFGFAFVCHFCFALSFFCHLVLHFIVIFLSFGLAFCVIFFSFSCRFLVRRGWLDPEPSWKIQKLTFYQHLSHLFVIFLSFSCRFVIQAQVPGSGADLESTGIIFFAFFWHFFRICVAFVFALFLHLFHMFFAFLRFGIILFAFVSHFFAFLRFGVILFAFILHFLSISFAFPTPK